MEDPDRPGDHACPHTLVTSIPDGIHKHKHTHNVNRWIEAKGPDAMALVGLPVWLWVADPTRTSWGPATISAGGVTLTARVDSVTWSLGDGTVLSCGKGSVWKRGMGAKPSPTCGHTYTRRGVYPVSATTHWVARWSGHGQAGTVRLDLVSSRRLEVGEVQVNGTGG